MKVLLAESEKKNISTIIYIAIGCIFLALLIAATIYSQTAYVSRLPLADVYIVEERGIDYTYRGEGVFDNGRLIVTLDFEINPKDIFLLGIINPGSEAMLSSGEYKTTGIVTSVLPNPDNSMAFLIDIAVENSTFQNGEIVNAAIHCEDIQLNHPVVPGAALVTNEIVGFNIFLIDMDDGPWGQRMVAVEKLWVDPWPEDKNAEYVFLIGAEINRPVIVGTDAGILYDMMEVRTTSDFEFDFEYIPPPKESLQIDEPNDSMWSGNTEGTIKYPIKAGLSGTLVISCPVGVTTSQLAEGFMKIYPDVNIVVESINIADPVQVESYVARLRTQLMSGVDAPDIVNTSFTLDFVKAADNGMIIDLYPFWNNDPDIVQEDYFENLIRLNEYKNGLYAIPTAFILDVTKINKRVTDSMNIDIDLIKEISVPDVLDIYLRALDDGIIGDNFKIVYGDPGKDVLLRYAVADFFDSRNKVARFDTPEFIEYLKMSNQIPTRQTLFSGYTQMGSLHDFERANNSFISFDAAFFHRTIGLFTATEFTSKGIFLLTPSGGYSIGPPETFAITGSCKNPDLAWEFIKYCIMESEEAPYGISGGEWNGDRWRGRNPINRNNHHKYMISTLDATTGFGFNDEAYMWLLEGIKRVDSIMPWAAVNFDLGAREILTLYFDQGLITAEEAARQLQERAEIYFGE